MLGDGVPSLIPFFMSESKMPLGLKANIFLFHVVQFLIIFSCRMPPKRFKFTKTCQFCEECNNHFKRHLSMAHLPWYMSPVTSCVDCQTSEGRGSQLVHFHERHQKIAGDWFFQAWFLLMNGVFMFLVQKLGLGTLQDLLVLISSWKHPPLLSVSLKKNIPSSENMIRERVWNLWLLLAIWHFRL